MFKMDKYTIIIIITAIISIISYYIIFKFFNEEIVNIYEEQENEQFENSEFEANKNK